MTLLRYNYYKILFIFSVFIGLFGSGNAQNFTDTINLPYKVTPKNKQPYGKKEPTSNINFRDPDSFTTEVEYDPNTNQYIIRNKIGNSYFGVPYTMSFQEFQEYKRKQNITQHWRQRFKDESFEQQKSFMPKINVGSQAFETIFGSNTIDIVPQGSAKLTFGIKRSFNENPAQSVELQKSTTFDFKEDIRINVTGKVGENLEMQISYNTESAFDFENTMKIRYHGNEDDIIQKIEAGDITMPLSTSLIRGSQSLFGVLTELRFGNLYVTSVFSQQEGETKTINVEGGAQTTDYEMEAVMYDKNRHFFLSHYFRENYDDALKSLPAITTGIKITKLEVWVTNTKRSMENARNILAFTDLGEEKKDRNIYGKTHSYINNSDFITSYAGYQSPDNKANSLYEKVLEDSRVRDINSVSAYLNDLIENGSKLKGGSDYEKIEQARKLSTSEYTFNTNLGYISLNQSLNADEVLAVSYEYTDSNGEIHQVGEFSTDGVEGSGVLMVKLLKGTSLNPKYTFWHLMMKNIYSMGAYQVNQDDFVMEVEYYDDATGAKLFTLPNRPGFVLPDTLQDKKLLNILNLDNLNTKLDYIPGGDGDGVFDFINGVTIDASKGKIIFPMLEPFGGYMREQIGDSLVAKRYVFEELYDSTQFKAEQVTAKNKYYLTGTFKSSGGSEIYLNSFNIPEGSVKVTAGGIELQEGSDYTVDYNMGRVKIVNQAYIASGTPLKITLENNSVFSIQSKTLLGTHLDYRFSDDFNLGATVLRLTERPLTEKVNIGEEPISNTIWGLNGSYRTDVPFLTKAVDFLPLIETKEMSSISLEGEFAQLRPGHNSAIGSAGEAFIDDFEGSESSIDVKSRTGWVLASIPQQFEGSKLINDLESGEQRAKLAWYQIDPLFYNTGSPVPESQREIFQAYRVEEKDITDRDRVPGESTYISTLDLAYYPDERGPYNYNSDELKENGKLDNPRDKWAGIMRELSTTDFETQNVEYIEFWMMDPFIEKASGNSGGKLIFNLGNVSEDIVKDGRKSYEHGLPTDGSGNVDTTAYGVVPRNQVVTTSFVNTAAMTQQDVGLDGLSSSNESLFFEDYLETINQKVTDDSAKQKFIEDPSADNYEYFRNSNHDNNEAGIIERYKNYNNHEGNTPFNGGVEVATQAPDVEDINGDFTLSENEAYFQYEIDLFKGMAVGDGYISDIRETKDKGFSEGRVKWYQFRIPISEFNHRVNDITDFKSIRFMRMFLTEWESPVVLRFAKLELVRAEWRKFDYAIKESDEGLISNENYDPTNIPFAISTVNIEENSARIPINYVLPSGVDRQQDPSNPQQAQLNEQSMSLRVKDLADGYSKAVYKTINMDMRDYGNLQMYVHAEQFSEDEELNDKDISCFIRLGTDYTDNYYEYEVPLMVTPFYNSERDIVWPKENNMLIKFDELIDLKQERNAQMRKANPTASITIPFSDTIFQTFAGNEVIRKLTIKGNPSLSKVKTIMIGIRNPLAKYNNMPGVKGDDGELKSAEIWVNELRLTDFDEEGGWAATGRMSIRLADFATVSIAGSTTKAGFGSIEQSGQERTKDEHNQVDVAANVELGRFLPKKANVRIPMYMGYSRTAINPKFNPIDQDVELKDALADPSLTKSDKDNLNNIAQDLTERKSLNFTNVGVGKIGKGKTRFYSPSNLSASYGYSLVEHHDVNTQYNDTRTTMGAINYVFSNRPKNIVPFKKVKFLRKPYMRIIGDFNFYYAPSQISFQTNMNMRFTETLLRNLSNPEQTYQPSYNKDFNWERKFNLKYNFSKSLKLDYAVNTNLTTDGTEDFENDLRDEYDKFKDEVWTTIMNMGTPVKHNQKLNISYTIPINKIPILDWVSATARYSSLYNWDRGPILRDESNKPNVKNATISNSQKITLNNTFRMNKLYNKVGFIERIDKKYKRSAAQRKKKEFETAEFKKSGVRFTANKPKSIIHNLKTEEEIKVELTSSEGKPIKSEFTIMSENKVIVTVAADVKDVNVLVTGKREKVNNPFVIAGEQTIRLLTGFKQISAAYSLTKGSILSGYKGDHNFGNLIDAPGLPFVFGIQDTLLPYDLARDNLLLDNSDLIRPFSMTNSESVNFKATYQPFKSLKIDFTAKRTQSDVFSANYFPEYIGEVYDDMERSNSVYSGSNSLDIWMLNTAFEPRPTETNQSSAAYDQFKNNIYDVAWKMADERYQEAQGIEGEAYNPGTRRDTSMPEGYSSSNPNVAIPAFLAAYSGQDMSSSSLNIFSWSRLRPTWRVKFDGLGKLDIAKKLFKVISLTHGYNSSFTISRYTSNQNYNQRQANDPNFGNMSWATGSIDSSLFVPEYDMSSFAVSEQFMPLFGVDLTWKSNVITKFEYKKTRAMTMSLANGRLTEIYTWDYVIGTGYRFDDLKLVVNQKPIVSDLNIRADLSIRDGITINRNLATDINEVTAGQKVYTFKLTADYQLSSNLTMQFFVDHKLTNPKTGNAYRNSLTNFGFMIQFSLDNL